MLKQQYGDKLAGCRCQSPSGGCVLKRTCGHRAACLHPVAFRRLCVETSGAVRTRGARFQSPSGGCVLKRDLRLETRRCCHPVAFRRLCVETTLPAKPPKPTPQSPSGGCVLKPLKECTHAKFVFQSPSGGCVLKHTPIFCLSGWSAPVAFRRLCVETRFYSKQHSLCRPVAFRRLCVET